MKNKKQEEGCDTFKTIAGIKWNTKSGLRIYWE